MTDEVEAVETEEAPAKAKVSRMPEDMGEGVGPHFPSGMNVVEAAIAGATDANGEPVELPTAEATAERKALGEGDTPEDDASGEADAGFDPGAHTVDDVLAYVDDNPDEADRVLTAEKAGKNRTTLVSQLEAR